VSPGQEEGTHQAVHDALYCSQDRAPTRRASSSCAPRRANTVGNSTSASIAQIFRGGCIIRAAFLQKITEAYARNPKLANLLLDAYFNKTIQKAQANWRKVISLAVESGISIPTFASALSYYDAYRSARLPANLLQAQRDYFGAHTYERTDKPRGKFFHIDWPEKNRPQLESVIRLRGSLSLPFARRFAGRGDFVLWLRRASKHP